MTLKTPLLAASHHIPRPSTVVTRLASSSTDPGPSNPPSDANPTQIPLPKPPKLAPRNLHQSRVRLTNLRALVNLHHTSQSFMHSPSDIEPGFDNAFNNANDPDPYFKPYSRWKYEVFGTTGANQPSGGIKEFGQRAAPEAVGGQTGTFASTGGRQQQLKPVTTVWKIFAPRQEQPWSSRVEANENVTDRFTDRELQVREALFGTWERGGLGMRRKEPNLDGVMEYLHAKGVTVEEYANEWERRKDLIDSHGQGREEQAGQDSSEAEEEQEGR